MIDCLQNVIVQLVLEFEPLFVLMTGLQFDQVVLLGRKGPELFVLMTG